MGWETGEWEVAATAQCKKAGSAIPGAMLISRVDDQKHLSVRLDAA